VCSCRHQKKQQCHEDLRGGTGPVRGINRPPYQKGKRRRSLLCEKGVIPREKSTATLNCQLIWLTKKGKRSPTMRRNLRRKPSVGNSSLLQRSRQGEALSSAPGNLLLKGCLSASRSKLFKISVQSPSKGGEFTTGSSSWQWLSSARKNSFAKVNDRDMHWDSRGGVDPSALSP